MAIGIDLSEREMESDRLTDTLEHLYPEENRKY